MTPQQYAMGPEEVKQEPQGPPIDKSQFTDIMPKRKPGRPARDKTPDPM